MHSNNKKKFIAVAIQIFLVVFLLSPFIVFAQTADSFFKAEVTEIIEQQKTTLTDGSEIEQQNLLLKGLEGEHKNKKIDFIGISEFDVLNKNIYKVGDRVLVVASFDAEGGASYYITDYVRSKSLWGLFVVFVLTLIVVGGWKGLRSLVSLSFTFLIIIKYIIPQILSGANPLVTTLLGSLFILLFVIYVTEGFRAKSHLAIASIFLSLVITILLSLLFVSLTRLTGMASEEVSFLLYIGDQAINFKGLLLAGIIIGALGVLDDVVISQISTVERLVKANGLLDKWKVFNHAYKVGVSHIASMTNTLFLAYAGVSLPLLILFVSGESAFSTWGQIVNNEVIATEIVRTLVGSIGLILSVPIATFIAVWWYKREAR